MISHQRLFQSALALGAAAVLVHGAFASSAPRWSNVVAFVLLSFAAENTAIELTAARISPSLLVIFAAIATFEPASAGFSAAVVGLGTGVVVQTVRARRWGALVVNVASYTLASAAAAVTFHAAGSADGRWMIAVHLAAVVVFCSINCAVILPAVVLLNGIRPREVWREMRPALPNYVAFGLVGLLVGLVCNEIGPAAIVLLVMPIVISRIAFASFQRSNDAHEAAIRVFGRLIEAKDPYTAGHTQRVAGYAAYVAEELGLTPLETSHLRHSALMHDVGKLAVPSALLNKPGKLTPEEWERVRAHNDAGIGILTRVDFMRSMAVTASDRHGHFAGGEDGATPEDLVREAHIVAVADAFDAMTSTRSYRRALSQEVAFAELRDKAGTQFNPACVEALIAAIERRGERYGHGYEVDPHQFSVAPPEVGVGSAGLGDLAAGTGP